MHKALTLCLTFLILHQTLADPAGTQPAGAASYLTVWYGDYGKYYSAFAVEVSNVKTADYTYFATLGYADGYSGLQDAGFFLRTNNEWYNILFSMWDNAGGKAENIWHAANVEVNTFGNEGTGVQTIAKNNSLAKWNLGEKYIIAMQAAPAYGGTWIRMDVYKPGEGWIAFAINKRNDAGTEQVGKMNATYSFLEDWAGKDHGLRQMEIHGAWYKDELSGEWQNITKFAGQWKMDYENISGNEKIAKETDAETGKDKIVFVTGGEQTGQRTEPESGSIYFKSPFEGASEPPQWSSETVMSYLKRGEEVKNFKRFLIE